MVYSSVTRKYLRYVCSNGVLAVVSFKGQSYQILYYTPQVNKEKDKKQEQNLVSWKIFVELG